MNSSGGTSASKQKTNQNIQAYVRVRPINAREKGIRSCEVVDVLSPKEVVVRQLYDSKMTKKFTFDRAFGPESKQSEVYQTVVAPLIEEVLSGYNCTVFAYGQTGTGKTHTMIGNECPELKSSWEDESAIGIIPRALSHLFDELRLMEVEFSMRISYLELYNEELCDLLSSDDSVRIRIFDDCQKKGSVIIQGLEEIPVHSKDDVYKLLEKGKERRKTATTLMNAQSSRSHTVFSILVHIKENGVDGEEMLKIGKLNLVDLAGSENISKAGNEKGIRARETVNINQSLLTLGRVITALVERTPHIPYRESKLTRLLQESLGGRTKTSIIATISPGHKDLEETLSTLEYAHRAKHIQNKPELNQKLTKKTVLKEYTEEIDRLKRDLMASRDKNGIYLAEETYSDIQYKLDSQNKELNEKMLLIKALKDDLASKEKIFSEVSLHLIEKAEELKKTEKFLTETKTELDQTRRVLNTTKRRYKEKGVLLKSHVKTEEELTNQATKLIEVADIATNDTVQLHDTIERRKDIDVKIKTVCEQFIDKMKNSFDMMNESLNVLNNKHSSHSQLIMEEIRNSTKLHNMYATDTTDKIKSISQYHNTILQQIALSLERYSTEVAENDQKIFLNALIKEIRDKELETKNNVTEHISSMHDLIGKNHLVIENHTTKLLTELKADSNFLSEQSKAMQSRFEKLSESTKQSLESEITSILNHVQSAKKISAQRRQKLMEILLLEDEEDEVVAKLEHVPVNIAKTVNTVTSNISSEVKSVQDLDRQFSERHIDRNTQLVQLREEATNILETNKKEFLTTNEDINNHYIGTQSIIDNLQKVVEDHAEKSDVILKAYEKNVSDKSMESTSQMENDCQIITDNIKTECARIKLQDTQNTAYTISLQGVVDEYSLEYNNHISSCCDHLEKFHQHELKTYTPTGQTPSRKEFSYPRILAATSPHSLIIKRVRLENEWSDLDSSSATLREDIDTTPCEMTNDSLVINSTPIKPKEIETNEFFTQIQNQFSFKVPKAKLEEQSSSRKNSPLIYDRENKENCGQC